MNDGRPIYRDEQGIERMPDHRDKIVMRTFGCALIERPPHGRRLGDVLLVQDGERKTLPGWVLQPGEPMKETLHGAFNVVLGPNIVLKDFKRGPFAGRVYEDFLFRTKRGMRTDHVAHGVQVVKPLATETPEFIHAIICVYHAELGERWEPAPGSAAIWVNWSDVSSADIAGRHRAAVSDYQAERNGAYRL